MMPAQFHSEVIVSPRFEIFYALQSLDGGGGERLTAWRRDIGRRLAPRLRTSIASVAPAPLIWPLLADALRDEPADLSFPRMIEALSNTDDRSFQRSVLAGVFKTQGAVDGLMSGRTTLADTVDIESRSQEKLLTFLGLYPFGKRSGSTAAFERIVSSAGEYRESVVAVLQGFWDAEFNEAWERLEPELSSSARTMRREIEKAGIATFAEQRSLPLAITDDSIVPIRGGASTAMSSVNGFYILPSVFNISRLWAAYSDSQKRTRYFIPIVDAGVSPTPRVDINPALIFRALGDTTRYAIASTIAHTPQTSVELARAFKVSKPTISHHVQLLRSAGLIDEEPGENGVVLSLNRQVLESVSSAASDEMFASSKREPTIKRSRRANS